MCVLTGLITVVIILPTTTGTIITIALTGMVASTAIQTKCVMTCHPEHAVIATGLSAR